MTTITRSRANGGADGGIRLTPQRSSRRPLLAVGSLVLVVACAAAFSGLYLRAGDRVTVLAVVHRVPEGAVIGAHDVTAVRVSLAPGLTTVAPGDADAVVGRRAAMTLVPGSLVNPADVSSRALVAQGDAVVGVAAKLGQLPAGGVEPGDRVDVLWTPTSDAGAVSSGASTDDAPVGQVAGSVLAPDVVVAAVTMPSADEGTAVVSVVVPSAAEPVVASASAAGQTAIAVVGGGS